mmetsp:Transcript_41192/g.62666  ORF Transcript_41192/g.62666 Transcript_41192/m.62666 type:complete len:158 (+) Transcript_41192:153-626(+)
MMIVVLPSIALSRASCTFFWLSSSRAEVASSRRSTFGLRIIVLAIATLCFWPPESFPPRIPHWVENPLARELDFSEASLWSMTPSMAWNSPLFCSLASTFSKIASSSSYFSLPIIALISASWDFIALYKAWAEVSKSKKSVCSTNSVQLATSEAAFT